MAGRFAVGVYEVGCPVCFVSALWEQAISDANGLPGCWTGVAPDAPDYDRCGGFSQWLGCKGIGDALQNASGAVSNGDWAKSGGPGG